MTQSELGNIVASGRATAEQWDEYWSAYAEDVEQQRREQERQERDAAQKRVQQEPFKDVYSPEIYYREEPSEPDETVRPVETPRRNLTNTASTAGIGLGSALAIVLSFQLNHSILWAIVHGILSWFYVLYRAWKGNY